MAFEFLGGGALDYFPCKYGDSKLLFRGPKRPLTGPYSVVLGGTEAFGKFVEQPFAHLLENFSNQQIVNLGCMYASIQAFADETTVLDICRGAQLTIIQLAGAQNMSNRFYKVHPRRNDRFLYGTELLHSVYSGLDFSEVHFTGHLISKLQAASARRFAMVREDLQSEWVLRMQGTLSRINGKVILLWLADHDLPDEQDQAVSGAEPMFLTRQMIDMVANDHTALVKVVVSPDEIQAGQERMIFGHFEQAAAQQMLGPIAHQEAARQLLPHLLAS